MSLHHPRSDDTGNPVVLRQPSKPTPIAAFADALRIATVVPGGEVPVGLNGTAFDSWHNAPSSSEGWATVSGQVDLSEPALNAHPGTTCAAGVIIVEPDGRVWLVAPSNGYGGYRATFPKGRIDPGISPQATAIREAFEESGLRVAIVDYLGDFKRTLTTTRYYRARRVGGNPADMGWESQAVHLVPKAHLAKVLNQPRDHVVVSMLSA